MHQETSGSLAFIARRQGQAGRNGVGRVAPVRRPLSHVFGLTLRLADMVLPIGGDGMWVDGRGRPALLRPLGVPLQLPMLPSFPFASSLIKVTTPCWFLIETKEVGPAGLELGQKFSNFFL